METQVNKIYFVKCPDNSDWYRTVRLQRNPMTGNLQSQLSNPVYGNPENLGIPEIPPLMRTKLMSLNNSLPHTY